MNNIVGANDKMKRSIGHFEHKGMFSLDMDEHLTNDMRRNILLQLGVTAPGTLERYANGITQFAAYLDMQLITTEKKETKQRRKYVTLDKGFLADMDRHIETVAFQQDMKPAHAYNNFVSDASYSDKLDNVIQKLLDNDWKEPAAESKLKKTYKNRYFMQQKSSNKD